MDEPQTGTPQNIFQVTEVTPPISQGAEMSPNFVPPDQSNLGDSVPPPPGGGIFRIIITVVIVIFLVLGIFFAWRYFKGRQVGKVTLTYWGLWEDEAVLQPLIDAYQKQNPNVTINYILQTPKTYRERLQAAINRGGEVDIFRFHNTWVSMLKQELAPLPESVYPKKEFETNFYPVITSDLKIGQDHVGIPLMIDGLALFYNEDILKAAGKTPPKTWDELHETALVLTVKSTGGEIKTAGVALGTASNIEHFSDILALMFLQNSANLKNPVGPEASEALAFYRMFAEKPNNAWDESQPNSIVAFAGGRVAMIFAPSWQAFSIAAQNPNLKFKTAPVPQLPGTNITWASYWAEGVAVNSKYQKEAWQFLKFLSEKDNLVKLYALESQSGRAFGEPYPRTDLAESLQNHPVAGAYILQAPQAKSFPLASRTHDNGLNDRLIKYIEDAVNSLIQGNSPDGALTTAAQGFQQVLSQYGLVAGASSVK